MLYRDTVISFNLPLNSLAKEDMDSEAEVEDQDGEKDEGFLVIRLNSRDKHTIRAP